ncbi:MAG TPA: L-threonylcarbamoyladenylate synthase [Polyangiaceae bacterium]|jgi:tRNA threonylcarbamoyl adenosine modification protein (Sua5/YciO/YrdC/YwlC family)|nr:L-threonylcarbamoyladenylate synthase [Polyangiaceae bacterium]
MNELVDALERGLVVAIATESSFGLFANATRRDALDALLRVKPRGAEKGIPVVLPNADAWPALVPEVPRAARALADACWPGALSIALRAHPELDPRLTLDGSVAVRVAGASPAAELALRFGKPLTATSANPPGEPPALTSDEVEKALGGAIRSGLLVVAAGTSPGGLPSTLLSVDGERVRAVRSGRVALSRVSEVLASLGLVLDEAGFTR